MHIGPIFSTDAVKPTAPRPFLPRQALRSRMAGCPSLSSARICTIVPPL